MIQMHRDRKGTANLSRTAVLSGWMMLLLMTGHPLACQVRTDYSVIETHTRSDRVRSGIAVGGLGTGYVELRKDGRFYNWTIMNNWPLGTGEPFVVKSYPRNDEDQSLMFFLVRYQVEGEQPRIKLLQLNNGLSEGALQGIDYYYPWMSAVERIDYSASFPFSGLTFTDPEMPFDIHLEVFSPFIPHDAKNSSLPGAYFNFTVEATGDKQVKVFLIATLRNLVGYDVLDKHFITRPHQGEHYKGYSMTCGGMDPAHSSMGEMGFFSLSDRSSYYLGWEHKHPYYEKLLVSDRFEDLNDTPNRNMEVDGRTVARHSDNNNQRCFSSIGVDHQLQPGQSFSHSFVFCWYFPNNYGGTEGNQEAGDDDYVIDVDRTRIQGHYYNNFFSSAEQAGLYLADHQEMLTEKTRRFHRDFYNSSVPVYVLHQVNSHFNTFIASSVFTKNGTFAIREGMSPHQPWGPYGTIDVALYGSVSAIALFPELQKNMMRAHRRLQTGQGEIHHGLQTDVELEHNGTWGVFHRIDLVPNYIQIVLRDYFWTGDRDYLKEMWPSVRKGIHYILRERDSDGDMMPDMEGIMCSYDNFPMYGLASYIQSQWMAAMVSVSRAAPVAGDRETGRLAEEILRQGRDLMDSKLWNGEYYRLSNDYRGSHGMDEGILTDQLIGQWVAHQSDLGYLVERDHVRSALSAIFEASYRAGFGLRNCTWPSHPDLYPIHETDLWVDQANTCWSGVELAFASFLIYEGMVREGEEVIRTVDNRYRKSGLYWDHQEFGGHYYRPMSAWSVLHAYLGLGISDGHYSFSPKLSQPEYTLFFSHGNGTAHYLKQGERIFIRVNSGEMEISSLRIGEPAGTSASGQTENPALAPGKPAVLINGLPVKARLNMKEGASLISFPEPKTLSEGDILEFVR